MPSTSLDDLDPRFRPLAEQWITGCWAAGVPVRIIDTLRTHPEQERDIASGVSWTEHSKHLPQPPDEKSLAMDLCPEEYLAMKNWNPTGAHWWTVASIAVSLGLRSGMDWHGQGLPPVGQVRPSWDPGHAEFVIPGPALIT